MWGGNGYASVSSDSFKWWSLHPPLLWVRVEWGARLTCLEVTGVIGNLWRNSTLGLMDNLTTFRSHLYTLSQDSRVPL